MKLFNASENLVSLICCNLTLYLLIFIYMDSCIKSWIHLFISDLLLFSIVKEGEKGRLLRVLPVPYIFPSCAELLSKP